MILDWENASLHKVASIYLTRKLIVYMLVESYCMYMYIHGVPHSLQSEEKEKSAAVATQSEGQDDCKASQWSACTYTFNCLQSESFSSVSGAVFGNPQGCSCHRVILSSVTPGQVLKAERLNNTPEKLASALLYLLFSSEELSRGNCTKPVRSDIIQLDSERLWAIKCNKWNCCGETSHLTYTLSPLQVTLIMCFLLKMTLMEKKIKNKR